MQCTDLLGILNQKVKYQGKFSYRCAEAIKGSGTMNAQLKLPIERSQQSELKVLYLFSMDFRDVIRVSVTFRAICFKINSNLKEITPNVTIKI